MSELSRTWDELATDSDLRCVVITGAGKAFCAGADVTLLEEDRSDAPESVEEELSFLPGDRVGAPVIAAVNGVCAGGGLHFVADADIAIASRKASFLDPHVSVGHVSALEAIALSPSVPASALMRMVLLGRSEKLGAERALEIGLVTEVVEPDDLHDRAAELSRSISESSPEALAESRRLLRTHLARLIDSSMQQGWDAIRAHWQHPDAIEGPCAFSEGRRPQWRRRGE